MAQRQPEDFQQDRYKIIHAPSSPVSKLLQSAKKIALSDLPVLILGPTGVGKENLARYIHSVSSRNTAPFIDINCGAIPAALFESELFGHSKGAFTGAMASRKGLFALAENGTLFLDEIGELPYALQAKLLRVLETRAFRPVGGGTSLSFQGRIVAATHRDLHALAKEGSFREDLFYRLAVLCLELPGLVQRKHDIPYLVDHFCSLQKREIVFTEEAMERLKNHNWNGNIRELKSLVDRLSILTDAPVVDMETLDAFLSYAATRTESSFNALADAILDMSGNEDKLALMEHVLIASALERSNGNKSEAARLLGVNRKVIERRAGKLANYAQDVQKRVKQADSMMQRGHFTTAVALLEACVTRGELASVSSQDESLLCEINYLLGVCYQRLRGWTSRDALFYYAKATELAKKIGNEKTFESTMFLLWTSFMMSLDLSKARNMANELLHHAKSRENPALMVEGHVAVANTSFWLCECRDAMTVLEESGLLSDENDTHAASHQIDMLSLGIMFHGLAGFQLGDFRAAKNARDRLLARGKSPAFAGQDRCFVLQGLAWIGCMLEEWELMEAAAMELRENPNQQQYTFYIGIGKIFHGAYLSKMGRFEEAEQEMAEGFNKYVLYEGGVLFQSFQAWQRGEALLMQGKAEQCVSLLSPSIEIAISHQERTYLAELMELRARAYLALGNKGEARLEFECALSTASVLSTVPARIKAAAQLKSLYGASPPSKFESALNSFTVDKDAIPPSLEKAAALLNV